MGFCALITAAFAAPLIYLVSSNFAGPRWHASRLYAAPTPLARSTILAFAVAAAASLLGTSAAWLATRTDLPGARLWRILLPLPLAIPSYIAATAAIAAFSSGGLLEGGLKSLGVESLPAVRGFWAAFIVLSLITYPYVYLPVAARIRRLPPSIEEAARNLGRRGPRLFMSVIAPQIKAAVAAGALLSFLYTLSDFGAVQLLRYDTLTARIYATRLFDRPASLALSLILSLVALGVVAAERWLSGAAQSAKGRQSVISARWPLGRLRAAAAAFVTVLVAFALAAPVAVLSFWAVRGLAAGSARAGAIAADIGQLARPAANSALAAIAAAVLSVATTAPVAYLTTRFAGRMSNALSAVIIAGFAVPGLAVALALAHWTLRAPGLFAGLYQTTGLLVFAYVVHFGAQALRASQVAIGSVTESVREAAAVLGAGRLRRLAKIELPLVTPGLLAGAGLVFMSSIKELPATLLLAPAGFQTLATKIWSATEDSFLADASIASLLLVALTGALTWLLLIRPATAP